MPLYKKARGRSNKIDNETLLALRRELFDRVGAYGLCMYAFFAKVVAASSEVRLGAKVELEGRCQTMGTLVL